MTKSPQPARKESPERIRALIKSLKNNESLIAKKNAKEIKELLSLTERFEEQLIGGAYRPPDLPELLTSLRSTIMLLRQRLYEVQSEPEADARIRAELNRLQEACNSLSENTDPVIIKRHHESVNRLIESVLSNKERLENWREYCTQLMAFHRKLQQFLEKNLTQRQMHDVSGSAFAEKENTSGGDGKMPDTGKFQYVLWFSEIVSSTGSKAAYPVRFVNNTKQNQPFQNGELKVNGKTVRVIYEKPVDRGYRYRFIGASDLLRNLCFSREWPSRFFPLAWDQNYHLLICTKLQVAPWKKEELRCTTEELRQIIINTQSGLEMLKRMILNYYPESSDTGPDNLHSQIQSAESFSSLVRCLARHLKLSQTKGFQEFCDLLDIKINAAGTCAQLAEILFLRLDANPSAVSAAANRMMFVEKEILSCAKLKMTDNSAKSNETKQEGAAMKEKKKTDDSWNPSWEPVLSRIVHSADTINEPELTELLNMVQDMIEHLKKNPGEEPLHTEHIEFCEACMRMLYQRKEKRGNNRVMPLKKTKTAKDSPHAGAKSDSPRTDSIPIVLEDGVRIIQLVCFPNEIQGILNWEGIQIRLSGDQLELIKRNRNDSEIWFSESNHNRWFPFASDSAWQLMICTAIKPAEGGSKAKVVLRSMDQIAQKNPKAMPELLRKISVRFGFFTEAETAKYSDSAFLKALVGKLVNKPADQINFSAFDDNRLCVILAIIIRCKLLWNQLPEEEKKSWAPLMEKMDFEIKIENQSGNAGALPTKAAEDKQMLNAVGGKRRFTYDNESAMLTVSDGGSSQELKPMTDHLWCCCDSEGKPVGAAVAPLTKAFCQLLQKYRCGKLEVLEETLKDGICSVKIIAYFPEIGALTVSREYTPDHQIRILDNKRQMPELWVYPYCRFVHREKGGADPLRQMHLKAIDMQRKGIFSFFDSLHISALSQYRLSEWSFIKVDIRKQFVFGRDDEHSFVIRSALLPHDTEYLYFESTEFGELGAYRFAPPSIEVSGEKQSDVNFYVSPTGAVKYTMRNASDEKELLLTGTDDQYWHCLNLKDQFLSTDIEKKVFIGIRSLFMSTVSSNSSKEWLSTNYYIPYHSAASSGISPIEHGRLVSLTETKLIGVMQRYSKEEQKQAVYCYAFWAALNNTASGQMSNEAICVFSDVVQRMLIAALGHGTANIKLHFHAMSSEQEAILNEAFMLLFNGKSGFISDAFEIDDPQLLCIEPKPVRQETTQNVSESVDSEEVRAEEVQAEEQETVEPIVYEDETAELTNSGAAKMSRSELMKWIETTGAQFSALQFNHAIPLRIVSGMQRGARSEFMIVDEKVYLNPLHLQLGIQVRRFDSLLQSDRKQYLSQVFNTEGTGQFAVVITPAKVTVKNDSVYIEEKGLIRFI